jgi:hypothetical protein
MALIWMEQSGDGVSVVETAAEVIRKLEDEPEDVDERKQYICFTLMPAEDEPDDVDPWRNIFIDRDSVYAVEQGQGHNTEEDNE